MYTYETINRMMIPDESMKKEGENIKAALISF